MKLYIKIFCFFLLFSAINLNAQVVNGGFESWSNNYPVGWKTNNSDQGPGIYPITRTTNSHTGMYAVKGEVLSVGPTTQAVYAPILQSGSDGKGFSFTARPDSITGKYMYIPAGGDKFQANVFLKNGDQVLGAGTFTTTESTGDTLYNDLVFHIGYIDSLKSITPNKLLMVFTISATQGIYTHEGSVFYLDDIPGLALLSPSEDDLEIAGEVDTLLWTAGGVQFVDLDYSTDGGNSFNEIVHNYPSDSGNYHWRIPKDILTRKARVKLTDSQNPGGKKDTSGLFKIKPWQLTRLTSNDKFELFKPTEDGWSFCNCPNSVWPPSEYANVNYQGFDPVSGLSFSNDANFNFAGDSVHPSWENFIDAFTTSQCYNGNPPSSFNSNATALWWSAFGPWGGSCYGFAVSSLLAFYHQGSLLSANPGMNGFQNLVTLPSDSTTRDVINKYYSFQFGEPFDSYDNSAKQSYTARKLLTELKAMFRRENGDASFLVYFNNNGSGAHAVTPYKMERIGETSTFNLKLYDSNVPGSENQIILIDSTNNQWTDNTGLGWGSGTNNIYLTPISSKYLSTPTIKAQNQQPKMPLAHNLQNGNLKIYNQSMADITITNGNGNSIGYSNNNISNNISGAVSKIPITGSNHPPIGYLVPDDNYTVELNNFNTGNSYVYITDGVEGYIYSRGNVQSSETDIVKFNDGVKVKNPDQSMRKINLTTILNDGDDEKIFEVNNYNLSPEDSLKIKQSNTGTLSLTNFGGSTEYDLRIVNNSGNSASTFSHLSIQLNGNSSQLVVPVFSDLANQQVKILIDNGNDGSYDDSTSITNEVTGINENNSSSIPTHYRLYSNYPNPFNPTTVISYELPVKSFVKLNIYNILGQRITTLVNSEMNAGTHRVVFNAGNLPSGIYLYSLSAGDFISTKKMLLVK